MAKQAALEAQIERKANLEQSLKQEREREVRRILQELVPLHECCLQGRVLCLLWCHSLLCASPCLRCKPGWQQPRPGTSGPGHLPGSWRLCWRTGRTQQSGCEDRHPIMLSFPLLKSQPHAACSTLPAVPAAMFCAASVLASCCCRVQLLRESCEQRLAALSGLVAQEEGQMRRWVAGQPHGGALVLLHTLGSALPGAQLQHVVPACLPPRFEAACGAEGGVVSDLESREARAAAMEGHLEQVCQTVCQSGPLRVLSTRTPASVHFWRLCKLLLRCPGCYCRISSCTSLTGRADGWRHIMQAQTRMPAIRKKLNVSGLEQKASALQV
jgi:hypothetical protein